MNSWPNKKSKLLWKLQDRVDSSKLDEHRQVITNELIDEYNENALKVLINISHTKMNIDAQCLDQKSLSIRVWSLLMRMMSIYFYSKLQRYSKVRGSRYGKVPCWLQKAWQRPMTGCI